MKRIIIEEEFAMKIAVTYENGEVFQHFGHSEQFKVYEVNDGKVDNSTVISATEGGHGALAGLLSGNDVSVLLCGGIGGGARQALAEMGIELYPGVTGNADERVADFLAGKLEYNANVVCNHHHEHGHHCGEDKHGCSGNNCGGN